jgi:hypothetical protein
LLERGEQIRQNILDRFADDFSDTDGLAFDMGSQFPLCTLCALYGAAELHR